MSALYAIVVLALVGLALYAAVMILAEESVAEQVAEAEMYPLPDDDLMSVARAVGVDRTAPLTESAADVQAADVVAEAEAYLRGEWA